MNRIALRAACVFAMLLATIATGCGEPPPRGEPAMTTDETPAPAASSAAVETRLATFGAGCFWCVEAVFQELKGVVAVTSGYSGGHVENPTYEQICTKTTGHAEVTQIAYDPATVTFDELLEVFWKTHDPTTVDRQGADAGPQYRSVVFAHDEEQARVAKAYKQKLDASGAFAAPIVTEITMLEKFWPAERYHQDYYANNPQRGYCRAVIQPKLEKFRKVFESQLK